MEEKRQYYDHIVVGCGGVGSAAVYWLSRRVGTGVLGLEQFKLGHDYGGSQDHSRIIRMAYDDDYYTQLTPETYKAFAEVEKESGLQLVHKTGGLTISRKHENPEEVELYAKAMAKRNIPFERMTGPEVRKMFPQFTFGDEWVAVYDKDSGLVDAALSNAVHTQLARARGATILDETPVTRILRALNGKINVNTTKGKFQCRKLIVTAGAWINDVLGSIGVHIPVSVTQEQVTYYLTPHIKEFTKQKYPIWIYIGHNVCVYGLPIHNNSAMKVALDAAGPVVTAGTRNYTPDPDREKTCEEFLENFCPRALGPKLRTKTCLYTMTPDRDFVVDSCAHAGWPDVLVFQGAGHAFKFSGLMGKILSQMAIDGKTEYEVSKFNITRKELKDPNYVPIFNNTIKKPDSAKL